MSETGTRPRVEDPFAGGMRFDRGNGPDRELVPIVGPAADRATAQIITAQRVAIKRNLPAILSEAKALATAAERKFFYSIPFKEKARDGGPPREVRVEGPSIDCAMAAVGCYGNCSVEAFPAQETAQHWTFMARFIDYEKGLTVTRSFNQRKSQSTGIRDEARNADIVFQIGQSKAMRNVIVGALKWLTDEMFQAAKSGVLERIEQNPDGARKWLAQQFAALDIELPRVERVVGRTVEKWLSTDMAKLFAELQALKDGFADADDLFPTSQAAAEERHEAAEEQAKQETAAEKVAEPEKPVRKPRAPREKPAVEETAAVSEASTPVPSMGTGSAQPPPPPATQQSEEVTSSLAAGSSEEDEMEDASEPEEEPVPPPKPKVAAQSAEELDFN